MGRKDKQQSDQDPGAPEWMVTFSDCMTLLLTFFVLLLSFSSFDDRVFRNFRVLFANALTTVSPVTRSDRDAFLYIPPVRYIGELEQGSEKPTLENKFINGLLNETPPIDFDGGLVFLISSQKLFLGRGVLLSAEGRQIMDTLSMFLKGVPSRIVISEYGPVGAGNISAYYGMPRAWAAVDYLTSKFNLDKGRFSISAKNAMSPEEAQVAGGSGQRIENGRMLEVLLLDRSLYN